MAFLLDLIDIKWFVDNYGDVLKNILDAIISALKGLSGTTDDENDTPEQ